MVYSGKDNYIFISYAHKDMETVLPIVEALYNKGYRVWYDSGIEVGTEWPEYIEERLSAAHTVVVFMTPNTIESRNCRNEINFALELKKEVLVVYLEDTELIKGMRLQLNTTQSMFKKNYSSNEQFLESLLNAKILQSCLGKAPETPVSLSDSASAQIISNSSGKTAQSAKNSSAKLVVALLSALLSFAVVFIGFSLFGGDKDDSESSAPSSSQQAEETVSMSDKLFDYTLDIEGLVVKLPFKYQVLADAGWTISQSGVSDTAKVAGDSYVTFDMSKNGKTISVSAYNKSGNAKEIKSCLIGEVSFSIYDGAEIKMAKNITAASTVDEIIAAFGTPNARNDNENSVSLTYEENGSYDSMVRFYIYADEGYKKHSYITLKNFVATENDTTETNTEKPSYLNSYAAPASLVKDYKSAVIQVGGDLYQLPAPVSAFTDNGWTITQSSAVKAGQKDSIRIQRDGKSLYLYIQNLAEYQTTAENCAVYRLAVEADDEVSALTGIGISFESAKSDVLSAVSEEFSYYEGVYSHSWTYSEYKDRDFNFEIATDPETEKVIRISLSCKNWDY